MTTPVSDPLADWLAAMDPVPANCEPVACACLGAPPELRAAMAPEQAPCHCKLIEMKRQEGLRLGQPSQVNDGNVG